VEFALYSAVLHSLQEQGEVSKWLCHDDSIINAVIDIYHQNHITIIIVFL